MAYLKFSADQLFDGYTFRETGSALITDESGIIEDIVDAADAGEDIQHLQGILSPGFINCHCHLELSHMKGMLPENSGLVNFVVDVIQKRHLPEDLILAAIKNAEDEMLENGIVAVGDICNNMLTLPQKMSRRMHYHNFIEASGYNPAIAHPRFERSLEFFNTYGQQYAVPAESNSITPHAPYSVSEELWKLIIHFPGNRLFTIHNQETAEENEWFMNKQGGLQEMYEKMKIDISFIKASGKSSLQTYLSKFLPNQELILVHNVHTSESDLEYCRTINGISLHWCLCINANQYITGHIPPIDLLMKYDSAIVLGTDSLASNHQLSILAEIRTIKKHFPHIASEQFLKWATINGAKALQMDGMLGSIEKGKQPGLLQIDKELTSVKRIK